MKKRLLSLFCAVSLLLTLLPTSVFAVEDSEAGEDTEQTGDTAAVETAPEETAVVSLTADELDGDLSGDDLLMGYLYSISGLEPEVELPAVFADERALPDLTDPVEKEIYDSLKTQIKAVADGTQKDTVFSVKLTKTSHNNGSLLNLSYHNAKAFATGTANRKFCVFARKLTSCGELRPPDLRKRQISLFDKRPSGASAARKAR